MIRFECHNCHTRLRTQDDKAGLRAQCPNCGTTIVTPHPDEPQFFEDDPFEDQFSAPPADPFDRHFGGGDEQSPFVCPESERNPDSSRTEPCPMCGEPVPEAASACPRCGEASDVPARPGNVPTSGLAIAALVCGLIGLFSFDWLFFFGFLALPCDVAAIVLGVMALRQIQTGKYEGKAQAWVGLGAGSLGLLISLAVLAFTLLQNA